MKINSHSLKTNIMILLLKVIIINIKTYIPNMKVTITDTQKKMIFLVVNMNILKRPTVLRNLNSLNEVL